MEAVGAVLLALGIVFGITTIGMGGIRGVISRYKSDIESAAQTRQEWVAPAARVAREKTYRREVRVAIFRVAGNCLPFLLSLAGIALGSYFLWFLPA